MNYDRYNSERAPLPGAGYVEDYTNAFLVSFGVLLFVGLFAMVAAFGFVTTVASALVAERLLRPKNS